MGNWRRLARFARNLAVVSLVAMACANGEQRGDTGAVAMPVQVLANADLLQLSARIVAEFPHDADAFTQGLLWFEGRVYESTGLRGGSTVRQVDLETGTVERKIDLPQQLFGEGLARIDGSLLQLTWQAGRAIRYDIDSFEVLAEHVYDGEGWGLCYDGVDVWRSDGTPTLQIHDPLTFAGTGRRDVHLRGEQVTGLNELECAEGWIYANVLGGQEILRIDPGSGRVMAVIDASDLVRRVGGEAGVLNGIAYRSESQTFLLTGKNWPAVFEVVFVVADSQAGGVH
jgi:glutamine cyclotransferase